MKDFIRYDNIDKEIIEISKNSLRNILDGSNQHAIIPTAIWGYTGTGISLLLAGLLTETFHNLLLIPGETFRAIFIVGGIVCLLVALKYEIKWRKIKTSHNSDTIMNNLTRTDTPPIAFLPERTTENNNTPKKRKTLIQKKSQNIIHGEK